MRNTLVLSAIAALVAGPMVALPSGADAATCHNRKVNGTLLGGVGGALLGGAVTHGSTGPIVGGVGGAVLGHEIGRGGCRRYARTYHRPARASYEAPPRRAVSKVYYDRYGNPVASSPVDYRR